MAHFRKEIISMILTNKCNFKCKYCLADDIKDGKKQTLDIDFAKQGIDDFFAERKSRKMRFYAMGEPTTEMQLMKKIHEYAKQRAGDELSVELQTNGFFPESTREWIAQNVDRVWISLDGPPDVMDQARRTLGGKSVRESIEGNIRFLLTHSKGSIGVRPTITNANLYRQVEMIQYFHSLGIENVWSHHEFSPVGKNRGILNRSVAAIDLLEYAKEAVRAWRRAEELGVFYRPFLAGSFDEECRYSCRACLPAPHLTFDGFVSACDMAFHGDTPLQDFIYGKWDPESRRIIYFKDKIRKLRSRSLENMPEECSKCEASCNCAGGCLGEAYFETGSIFGIRPDHCEAVRYLAKHLPRNQGRYLFEHP
jgi:radical SAM protein with 4Fe4S-binding SPASM domain